MALARLLTLVLVAALFAVISAPADAQSRSKSNPNAPRVYLLRGLANIFSLGMDDLTEKLKAKGVRASVHSYSDIQTLTNIAIEEATRNKRRPTPIIIVGHSLGANAAVTMGNRVAAAGVPVPLVVTFDPVNSMVASAGIGRVVNYYQGGGSGKPVSGERVDNIDLTGTPQLSHWNIDKAPDLHSKVIAMIQRPPRAPAARTPRPSRTPAPTVSAPAPSAPVAPTARATRMVPTETAAIATSR